MSLEAEISKQKHLSAYHLAAIYVALNDTNSAFQWLNEAIKNRADWLVFLKVDPRFDPLHSDPRSNEILRQINLES